MQPRLSLLTLGVVDIARARQFYERLGFVASSASTADVVFFPAGGVVLGLYGRQALAADAGLENDAQAPSGVSLAHNVASEAEVEAVLREAVAAGGRLVKAAYKIFWGGYVGFFADPDGHLWEVAHNPGFPLDADGRVELPPPPVAS